jgi:hypothetical protein
MTGHSDTGSRFGTGFAKTTGWTRPTRRINAPGTASALALICVSALGVNVMSANLIGLLTRFLDQPKRQEKERGEISVRLA